MIKYLDRYSDGYVELAEALIDLYGNKIINKMELLEILILILI